MLSPPVTGSAFAVKGGRGSGVPAPGKWEDGVCGLGGLQVPVPALGSALIRSCWRERMWGGSGGRWFGYMTVYAHSVDS